MIQKNVNGGADKIQESSKNHTVRVGYDFNREVQMNINEKRKEEGRKPFSMNVLTNLLIKHNSWNIIVKDLVNFDLKGKHGK